MTREKTVKINPEDYRWYKMIAVTENYTNGVFPDRVKICPILHVRHGDQRKSGMGKIEIDFNDIDTKQDIAITDMNNNLLEYYFEEFNPQGKADISIYNTWVRDGSNQIKLFYGK